MFKLNIPSGYGVINEEIVNSFFMLIVSQLCYAGDAGKQV